MPDKIDRIDFAELNEKFADDLEDTLTDHPSNNWVIIARFYTFLHYVEKRLRESNNGATKHHLRLKNIKNCKRVDNRARTIYRELYDLSEMARYKRFLLDESAVEESERKLEEGKSVLGYTGDSGDAKYST